MAAIDLRRLQSPRGTALAWTGAAVFGDCTAYQRLSIVDDERSEQEVCRALRARTEPARQQAGRVGIDVRSVEQRGRSATVGVELRRGDQVVRVELPLRRKGDGWGVVLTDEVCDVVGCP